MTTTPTLELPPCPHCEQVWHAPSCPAIAPASASPELPDLDRLEALARAATPGPWSWWTSNSVLRLTGEDGIDGGVLHAYARRGHADICCGESDRAFIAAANPAAVLALIALARRAQPEGRMMTLLQDAARAWNNEAESELDAAMERIECFLLKSRAQPEGEAPQAEPVACVTDKYSRGGYNDEIDVLLPVGTKLYKHPPAAQHAEGGAQAEELRATLIELCEARSKLIDANAELTMYHLAAQSQGAQPTHCDPAEGFCAACRKQERAAKAEAPAPEWGRVRTVGDMVRNLLTLNQAEPIFSAFHVDFDGARRCRTSPISISHERVIDGKWVDQTRKDVPYATVVWAKPDERAQQAAAPDSLNLMNADEMAALRRFDETCQDGEGYDVPKTMMQRLAAIGVVRRTSGSYYETTEFGLRVLDQPAPSAPGTPEAPDLFSFDELADACVAVEIPDSQYESLCIALTRAAQLDGGQGGSDHVE